MKLKFSLYLIHLVGVLPFFFYSCANIPKSGRYIKLNLNENLEYLAEKYHTSVNKIKWHNPEAQFVAGEIIFIPVKGGMADILDNKNPMAFFKKEDLVWPVPEFFQVSSEYGKRWGKHHEGIDIPAPVGTPIVAITNGQVVYSGNEMTGYGNITVLSHLGGYFTVYAHASKNLTQNGQSVKKGETISLVGNTGHSTGPHLHFELREEGETMDPRTLTLNTKLK